MSRRDRKRQGGQVLAIVLVALMALPVQAKVVDRTTTFDEPISSGLGGRTLLVEEITATWCPTCAEVDPELMQVADSHGSRVALVALHPTDGEDAFMPPASQHRIDRLQTINPSLQASTPTFVVEGGEPRIGYDGWQDVQRDILSEELERQQVSELAFEVARTDNGFRATVTQATLAGNGAGQLTFMVLEHHKMMPKDAYNPGEDTRDRVLVAIAECNLDEANVTTDIGLLSAKVAGDCLDSFEIEFDELSSWSVILLHEPATSSLEEGVRAQSFGVVELAYRDRAPVEESNDLQTLIIAGCLGLAIAAIYRKK